MNVLSPVLGVVLAAAPAFWVLPQDDEPASEQAAQAIAEVLSASERPAQVAPVGHPLRRCGAVDAPARTACVSVGVSGSQRVVIASGAELGERFAITASVLGSDGAPLGEAGSKGAKVDHRAIAAEVVKKLAEVLPVPLKVEEPLRAPTLAPEPAPAPVVPLPEPAASTHTAAWISTAALLAAAGVAVGFLASGLSQKSQLDTAQAGQLRRSQALSLESAANTQLSVALGAAIGAAVLGVLTVILWGTGS